ncbi:MAG: ferredoxin:thioredoxin reductase [Candidatus Eisenbacteria bacterium]|nr:ferredoxin:thioredoxin reductase [Candidatus Eisenbacteria bacterium]
MPEDEVQRLYEALKRLQEPRGYYLNADSATTTEILRGLLKNRARYGYMSCPCRLASGEHERDKDIICPCVYREADVGEYGRCYCGLYVSRDWLEGRIPHVAVPERRPPEKTMPR